MQAGFRHPDLAENLGEIYHRLAEDLWESGQTKSALKAATEANRVKSDKQLDQLTAHLQQALAYEAAQNGDWGNAKTLWTKAHKQAGGNFRLLCNLALAMEQDEMFEPAAELWRQAMRRRPRKSDHPDAIDEAQVARLWQRTAKAYQKADDFEEALVVQKNAVKWQPDNLALRFELAEGYLENGRFQAAENELSRILDRDKKYIPALMLMGDLLAESDYFWYEAQASRYWEQVLEIDPRHADARQNFGCPLSRSWQSTSRLGPYPESGLSRVREGVDL